MVADINNKPIFVGREKELKELFEVFNKERSVTIVSGEAGIGKSALLEELDRRLEEDRTKFFVGFYDQNQARLSASTIYPFIAVLGDLLKWVKERESFDEKMRGTFDRLGNALKKTIKGKGSEMVGAIVSDITKKIGLEKTASLVADVANAIKEEKSAVMLADAYVREHNEEFINSYVEIFKSLAEEFPDRCFVLIFDEFESVRKASIDIFIDFIKSMPKNIHAVVSFEVEEEMWSDMTARKLFEYSREKLLALNSKGLLLPLGANELELKGLSAEEIGIWIKSAKGKDLPLDPDLIKITDSTAGFPLLLTEWIAQSKDLDYNELKGARNKLCRYIQKRTEGLNEEDLIRINKLSVLIQPLSKKELAELLDTKFDLVPLFIARLKKSGLFEDKADSAWFRHQLVQRCLEDGLDNESKQEYNGNVSKLYLKWLDEIKVREKYWEYLPEGKKLRIGLAHYLHQAGNYELSYSHNFSLAESAYGDYDLGERCYRRAIEAAEKLMRVDYKMKSMRGLAFVYAIWGKYDESLNLYSTLLKYYSDARDFENKAGILTHLADIYDKKGNYDRALELYNEEISLIKEHALGYDEYVMANIFSRVAYINQEKGDYDKALELYNESLSLDRKWWESEADQNKFMQTHQIRLAGKLRLIAQVHRRMGNYEKALEIGNESLSIYKEIGEFNLKIIETLSDISWTYFDKGDYAKALEICKESLSICVKDKYHLYLGDVLRNMGEILVKMPNPDILDQSKLQDMSITMLEISRLLKEIKMYKEALYGLFFAYLIFKDLGSPNVEIVNSESESIGNIIGETEFLKIINEFKNSLLNSQANP